MDRKQLRAAGRQFDAIAELRDRYRADKPEAIATEDGDVDEPPIGSSCLLVWSLDELVVTRTHEEVIPDPAGDYVDIMGQAVEIPERVKRMVPPETRVRVESVFDAW